MQTPAQVSDVLVVGGGFFGANVALHAARKGLRVTLLEREKTLLSRASYVNQARVHGGYHYPRSVTTGLRSRLSYERFIAENPTAVHRGFEKVYAIARRSSHVTAQQFALFCERIHAPLREAPKEIHRLFSPDLIEAVFVVEESAFNAARLRETLLSSLIAAGVQVLAGVGAQSLEPARGTTLRVRSGEGASFEAKQVFLCTYAFLNDFLRSSTLPCVELRHELAEMVHVTPPPQMTFGVTVMDGPFFSCMPFPAEDCFSLSHVAYTPHFTWSDAQSSGAPQAEFELREKLSSMRNSHYMPMIKDSSRYLPVIANAKYLRSHYEIKTLLPRNEQNDGRPILFRRHHGGVENFHLMLGAKFDNIYDCLEDVDALL